MGAGPENDDGPRFPDEVATAFHKSKDGQTLMMHFSAMTFLYLWPFQTLLQMPSLIEEVPAKRAQIAGNLFLLTTWPQFLVITFVSLGGLSRQLSHRLRIVASAVVLVILSVLLLFVVRIGHLSTDYLKAILYAFAPIVAFATCFIESSLYVIGGLLPTPVAMQTIHAGNGLCGLVVAVLVISAKVAARNGLTSGLEEKKTLFTMFFGLLGLSSLLLGLIFDRKLRKNIYVVNFVESRNPVITKPLRSSAANSCDDSEVINDKVAIDGVTEHIQYISVALKYVFPAFLAMCVNYGTTTALWPVIPGSKCPMVSSSSVGTLGYDDANPLQDWWPDVVILCFNIADFFGKTRTGSLQWGASNLSPRSQLGLTVLRALICVPWIIGGGYPQSWQSVLISLCGVFALGISNGWIAAVCFMRAPMFLPRGSPNVIAENAVSVPLMGLHLGLSAGNSVSDWWVYNFGCRV